MTLLRSSLSALALAGSALTLLVHCAPAATDSPSPLGTLGATASMGGADGSPASVEDATSPGTATPAGDDAAGSEGGPQGTEDSSSGSDGGPGIDANPSVDCPARALYPQTSFVNLAVTPGQALTPGQGDSVPGDAGIASPAGWDFHQGGTCRDGSPAGFFVHFSSTGSDRLFIYLEGGGACDSATFCSHNPANIQTVFGGGAASQGQTIGGSLGFASTGQVPYTPTPAQGLTPAYSPGLFDFTNADNPFKDWNAVYVPYCTGDVHFGTRDDVDIPGDGVLPALPHQHFVGHLNLQSYIARIVPTFPKLSQVLLTGASAGAFGAGLNYAMVQDSFGSVPVVVMMDSALPFRVKYLPACLQKKWRELWGFDDALPKDCAECFDDDGSGLTDIVYYLLHKYAGARVAAVTTMEDEIIRLFYAQGVDD
ncbi:MAG: pectin acetylesterase-family hydrolase, partial [Polyangiaceae bacterium]